MTSVKRVLYDSGDVFLPLKLRNLLKQNLIGDSKNTFYISNWSIVHLLSGILFGFLINKYLIKNRSNLIISNYYFKMFMLHTTWECWQVFVEMSNPLSITGPSNILDTIIDTILFMFGAVIYKEFINKYY
jgi:hypothetical protein